MELPADGVEDFSHSRSRVAPGDHGLCRSQPVLDEPGERGAAVPARSQVGFQVQPWVDAGQTDPVALSFEGSNSSNRTPKMNRFDRRTLIHGGGASMLLPFLPSLAEAASEGATKPAKKLR